MTLYECFFFFFHMSILSLAFSSLKLFMYCLILYKKEIVYRGVLEYVATARGSKTWLFMKGAPPGLILRVAD